MAADFNALAPFIGTLAGVGQLQCRAGRGQAEAGRRRIVHAGFEAYVSLAGLIDVAAEVKRLEKQLAEKRKHLHGTKAKLANENFVEQAPAEVVQQQRELVADIEKQIATMEADMRELQVVRTPACARSHFATPQAARTMTPETAMDRINTLLAHAWMVCAFLKHADEVQEDAEMMEVHRMIFDYCRAVEPAYQRRDAAEYLHRAPASCRSSASRPSSSPRTTGGSATIPTSRWRRCR